MSNLKLHTGIYMILNIKNGRYYIGSAMRFNKRWKEHLRGLENNSHHSKFMQRDWNKCGKDCFRFIKLVYCEVNDLISTEQKCIDIMKPVYNSAPVAGSMLGFKMSDESKRKLSDSAKRTKNFTGHKHTEETKEKISATKTGVKLGKYGKDRVEKTAAAMRVGKNCLQEHEVIKILDLKKQGFSAPKIAKAIGRNVWPIYDVLQGKTYRWVNRV